MNEEINHRGPDDSGVFVDSHVSLGCVRLSIIDLSAAGRQPMANEDGSVIIVYNGEVYNFEDLRRDLEAVGHTFKSRTDTEVVLHAYQEWGIECLEKFNGMWAFAIYDSLRGQILLSRDRFGIKPLYFSTSAEGNIAFSSEIKGLLRSGVETKPNDRAILEYLSGSPHREMRETFFDNISEVLPGEILTYDMANRKMTALIWYHLGRIKKPREQSIDLAAARIREMLEESVRRRLVSDVPVGSCLSGGIDSSSIVLKMRDLKGRDRIETFSLVFPGSRIDESQYIDLVAAAAQVESNRMTLSVDELLNDIQDLVRTQEEPFQSLSIYGQYRLMKLAHDRNVKVLLDGQGGDELFAGYQAYFSNFLLECLVGLRVIRALKELKATRPSLKVIAKSLIASIIRNFALGQRALKYAQTGSVSFLRDPRGIHAIRAPHSLRTSFSLNRTLMDDISARSIPLLLRYEDKNSMRWSVEARIPYLDFRLVEYVALLPSHYKIRNGWSKYILRKAVSEFLPPSIVERKDKIAFETPDGDWFRTPRFLNFLQCLVESKEFKSRGYWNQQEVRRLIAEHAFGDKDNASVIWRLVNVELWLREFFDGKTPSRLHFD